MDKAKLRRIRRNRREFLAGTGIGGGSNAIAYILRDTFSIDIAAGSLDGTLADTGQARKVTDTNSKLSTTGGKASFATGGSASANPGLWWDSLVTIAGRLIKGTIAPNGTSGGGSFGFDSDQVGNPAESIRFAASNVININFNAGSNVNIGTFTNGQTYYKAVVQRAAGFFFYIKGGTEFTNWTLVWISAVSVPGTFYPAAPCVGATDIHTLDDVVIPDVLYAPSALAYDTFTRSNGALGSTESTDPDSQTISPLAWQFATGVWTISTNKAIATPTPGSEVIVNGAFAADTDWTKGTGWAIAAGVAAAVTASANLTAAVAPLVANRFYQVVYTVSAFAAGTVRGVIGGKSMPTHAANATYTEIGLATTTAFLFTGAGFTGSLDNVSAKALLWSEVFATVLCSTADVWVGAAITIVGATSGVPAGVVANLDDPTNPANFVLAYLDGVGNVVIAEMVAGTITVKQTQAVTYSAGATLWMVRSATDCRVFYNNAAVGTVQTMTSNTSKYHGAFDPTALNSLDNLTIRSWGSDGAYNLLDTY